MQGPENSSYALFCGHGQLDQQNGLFKFLNCKFKTCSMPPHYGNQLQSRKEQKDIEENNKVVKLH